MLVFLYPEHPDLLTRLKTIPGIGNKTAIILLVKGKSKKAALIAVCDKLLTQAFAIAKSGLIFDKTYRSTLVKN